jgi:hypothetical protein
MTRQVAVPTTSSHPWVVLSENSPNGRVKDAFWGGAWTGLQMGGI